ncbi:MAG: hypothetical protein E2P02_04580 [Acidobacteria bacterium]|nr:MAG: hypothetical protein E2P02_04580 [Acidobacteriota bacterium]
MAREHAEDAPVSNEISDASPAVEVETSSVVYATVDGDETYSLVLPIAAAKALPIIDPVTPTKARILKSSRGGSST